MRIIQNAWASLARDDQQSEHYQVPKLRRLAPAQASQCLAKTVLTLTQILDTLQNNFS